MLGYLSPVSSVSRITQFYWSNGYLYRYLAWYGCVVLVGMTRHTYSILVQRMFRYQPYQAVGDKVLPNSAVRFRGRMGYLLERKFTYYKVIMYYCRCLWKSRVFVRSEFLITSHRHPWKLNCGNNRSGTFWNVCLW